MTTDAVRCACYYREHRDELLAKRRVYHAEHREAINHRQRAYGATHREESRVRSRAHNAQVKELRRKRQVNHLRWMRDIKAAQGCTDCGTHGGMLDHHHLALSTKRYSLTGMSSYSLESIFDEIAKCTVLCRSCHRRRHA